MSSGFGHVYCLWPACWGLSCIVLTECVITGPSDTGQILERLMCICICVCVGGIIKFKARLEYLVNSGLLWTTLVRAGAIVQ